MLIRSSQAEIQEALAVPSTASAKHLIDVDEESLHAARAELGTSTIKDTVNEALRRATRGRRERATAALDILATPHLVDRDDAWR